MCPTQLRETCRQKCSWHQALGRGVPHPPSMPHAGVPSTDSASCTHGSCFSLYPDSSMNTAAEHGLPKRPTRNWAANHEPSYGLMSLICHLRDWPLPSTGATPTARKLFVASSLKGSRAAVGPQQAFLFLCCRYTSTA